jgi:hypothetical protein
MGLRFQRRIRIAPGLRLNLSRSGISTSVGGRGAWTTFGPRGRRRITLGLPGSGLFWTEQWRARAGGASGPGRLVRWLIVAMILIGLLAVFG